MTPLDEADLVRLRPSAQEAIRRACQRVDRAEAARDVEAVIGASKELVETVGKSIVDALGGTYGSDIDRPLSWLRYPSSLPRSYPSLIPFVSCSP